MFNPLDHPIAWAWPDRLTGRSAWVAHIPFAMVLVDRMRPQRLVELGTQWGDSYCAFCQAVERVGAGTQCYAVDTWRGDEHAGFYGPEVLEDLRAHHDPRYASFSRLVQSTFDDAVEHFEDGSIDLLHIDGYHAYQAVEQDFRQWLRKLQPSGVVLLHDINVREGSFGVWKLWHELRSLHPSFELHHGHGLGLLVAGERVPPAVQPFVEATDEQAKRIRELFFHLGHRLTLQSDARAERAAASAASEAAQSAAAARETELQGMAEYVRELEVENQELEQRLHRLEEETRDLREHARRTQSLERRLREEETRDLREQARRTRSLERRLREVEDSTGFRLIEAQRRVMDTLLPVNSRRRQPYVRATRAIGALLGASRDPGPDAKPADGARAAPDAVDPADPQRPSTLEHVASPVPRISVVIPTKNGEEEGFEACLSALRAQEGVGELELVVVDSGSTDRTLELAHRSNARIVEIDPEEFNHGTTRNLGGDCAAGPLVLFTVQDAVMGDRTVLRDMARLLLSDEQVAAVSTRQLPRGDADLFSRWQLYNHHLHLGDGTRIRSVDDPAELDAMTAEQRRRLACLDDVCSLHRHDVWQRIRYKPVRYAEDVDYALRCLRRGHALGFLGSSGVLHSHTRPPRYHLTNHYIVHTTLADILGESDPARGERGELEGLPDLVASVAGAYASLNAHAASVDRERSYEVDAFAKHLDGALAEDGAPSSPAPPGEPSLDPLFDELLQRIPPSPREPQTCRAALRANLRDLVWPYFASQHGTLSGRELLDVAYKAFGMTAGAAIGDYVAHADGDDEQLRWLDGFLERGVVR